MANEVQGRGPGTGRTCFFTIHNQTSGYIWSTSGGTGAYESFTSGNWSDYSISMTEQGVSNLYLGSIPAAVPAGVLSIDMRQQLGGSPVQTDPAVAAGDIQWRGPAVVPLSDLATSGQIGQLSPMRVAKGVAISGFMLYLKSAADHITPFTSGVVSGQIMRNAGGTFVPLQSGVFTEQGLGWYSCNFTSGDLNGNTIAMLFTANGISGGTSDPLPLSFVTQRVSGSF